MSDSSTGTLSYKDLAAATNLQSIDLKRTLQVTHTRTHTLSLSHTHTSSSTHNTCMDRLLHTCATMLDCSVCACARQRGLGTGLRHAWRRFKEAELSAHHLLSCVSPLVRTLCKNALRKNSGKNARLSVLVRDVACIVTRGSGSICVCASVQA